MYKASEKWIMKRAERRRVTLEMKNGYGWVRGERMDDVRNVEVMQMNERGTYG